MISPSYKKAAGWFRSSGRGSLGCFRGRRL